MSGRRAPRDGYDFGNKRQERREIWATFRRECPTPIASAHVLLMPSLEGDEIDVATANGFRQQNMHVVDWNPAIVATLKRRYPKIHTYGVELGRAVERMAAAGISLSCANLDLCGCLSETTGATMLRAFRARAWVDEPLIAVTVLRGRERKSLLADIDECAPDLESEEWRAALRSNAFDRRLTPRDYGRLMFVGLLMGYLNGTSSHLRRARKYRSVAGSQTMLWGLYQPIATSA
jgi:hypothetical protein